MTTRKSKSSKVYKAKISTGEFVAQNPSKGSVWSGLSKTKTIRIEKNLRGVMKESRGVFLSKELARYKGIKIIED